MYVCCSIKLVPVGADVGLGVGVGVEAGEGLDAGEGVVVTGVDGESPGLHCQYLQLQRWWIETWSSGLVRLDTAADNKCEGNNKSAVTGIHKLEFASCKASDSTDIQQHRGKGEDGNQVHIPCVSPLARKWSPGSIRPTASIGPAQTHGHMDSSHANCIAVDLVNPVSICNSMQLMHKACWCMSTSAL